MPYTVQTKRLTLRSAEPIYTLDYLSYKSKNRMFHKEWEPLRHDEYFSVPAMTKELTEYSELFKQDKTFKFLIYKIDDESKIIGDLSFSNIVKGVFLSCHLGYAMDQDYINNGLMSEALLAGIKFFFDIKKYHRIEANVMLKNKPSIRLLEKLGFKHEGLAKKYLKINGQWEDHIHYVLLNENIE